MVPFVACQVTAIRLQCRASAGAAAEETAAASVTAPVAEGIDSTALRWTRCGWKRGYGLLLRSMPRAATTHGPITALAGSWQATWESSCRRLASGQSSAAPEYLCLKIKEIDGGPRRGFAADAVCMDRAASPSSCQGAGNRPNRLRVCRRVDPREPPRRTQFQGDTVVDPATVMTTHPDEVVKDNLRSSWLQRDPESPRTNSDRAHQTAGRRRHTVSRIFRTGLQRVLQESVAERIWSGTCESTRRHLRSAGNSPARHASPKARAERLGRQIAKPTPTPEGVLALVHCRQMGERIRRIDHRQGEDRPSRGDPDALQQFHRRCPQTYDA